MCSPSIVILPHAAASLENATLARHAPRQLQGQVRRSSSTRQGQARNAPPSLRSLGYFQKLQRKSRGKVRSSFAARDGWDGIGCRQVKEWATPTNRTPQPAPRQIDLPTGAWRRRCPCLETSRSAIACLDDRRRHLCRCSDWLRAYRTIFVLITPLCPTTGEFPCHLAVDPSVCSVSNRPASTAV
ncbi:hypothetical protein EV356DRAFT_388971 [Viridothelium virens]|uniref:Uncharacterized protein n=1 Tax=Viridothelium virens TaxID=1048519 RepID=A0A6A6GUF0_VIRVR|nr:hypothetical protein EV356DRAFT_388971 [Viridothelium virens]